MCKGILHIFVYQILHTLAAKILHPLFATEDNGERVLFQKNMKDIFHILMEHGSPKLAKYLPEELKHKFIDDVRGYVNLSN